MKRILSILIICFLVFASVPFSFEVYAEAARNLDKAQILRELGLFKGTGNGFELEREAYRVEGGVMVVRLLGEEESVKSQKYLHPFEDVPSWADPYIGYMYHAGLTRGTSDVTYSPHIVMPAIEYMTFVLRALGYDDTNDDFNYRNSLEKALEIGLINQNEYDSLKSKSTFLRDDVVDISFKALGTNLKGSSKTLMEKLVEDDGVISVEKAAASGLYSLEEGYFKDIETSDYGYIAKNAQHLAEILKKAIIELETNVKVDLRDYTGNAYDEFEAAMEKAKKGVTGITGINNMIKSWSYEGAYESMEIDIKYFYSQEHLDMVMSKAREIVESIIEPGMTDYQKELAIHDYIINNTEYDYDGFLNNKIPEESYTVYGTLILGKAVCQGYAETMNMLSFMAGLECEVVSGEAFSFESWGGHAWNILKIDGEYYHVDATFNDPVLEDNEQILSHNYFNLTDADISKNHRWEKESYPACSSTKYNYFYKNSLVIENKPAFVERVENSIEVKEQEIVLKIVGFKSEDYKDISEIVFSSEKVKSFSYSVNKDFGIIRICDIQYY